MALRLADAVGDVHPAGGPVAPGSSPPSARGRFPVPIPAMGPYSGLRSRRRERRMATSSDRRRPTLELLDQLGAVDKLSATVASAEGIDAILQAAISALLEALPVDRASVLLFDDDGVMRFKAWANLSADYRRAVDGHSPWKPGESDPAPVLVPDVRSEPTLAGLRDTITAEGIGALAFIPLTARRKLLGKFTLYCDQPHVFTPEEVRLAGIIARHIAFALERRLAEQVLQQREEALRALTQQLELQVKVRTEALRHANQNMEVFVHSAAHDLRAPLRAIHGYIDVLLEEHGESMNEEGRAYTICVRESARRMDALIRDLLAYSRLHKVTSGQAAPLLAAVEEARRRLEPELERTRALLEIDVDPSLRVRGHGEALVLVVLNLLTNAITFVPPGVRPRIAVSAERSNGFVRLWVQDNGIGIAPDHQARIFGIFERLHGRGDYPGTGAGLAFVRWAMLRMGGIAGVQSDVGSGSRFWIELPEAQG